MYDESKETYDKLDRNGRRVLVRKWKKQILKSVDKDFVTKFPDFEPQFLSNLYEIEVELRCRIYLWGRRSKFGKKYECFRHSPYMPPTKYDNYVDIILVDAELELNLEKCGLIFDIDTTIPYDVRFKRKTWTIFEAAAIHKKPELEENVFDLRSVVTKLEAEWGRPEFHFADAKEFFKQFRLCVQVWTINDVSDSGVFRYKIFDQRGEPKLIGVFSKKI